MRKRRRFRRALWIATALTVALGGAYAYITRPAALRTRLGDSVKQAGLSVRRIDRISFSPWGGLDISGLELDAVDGSPLAPPALIDDPPPLVSIPHARVRFALGSLLLGAAKPREVLADGALFRIIRDDTGAPQSDAGRPLCSAKISPEALPRLLVRNADVQVLTATDSGLRLIRRWVVTARGGLTANQNPERQRRADQNPERERRAGHAAAPDDAGPVADARGSVSDADTTYLLRVDQVGGPTTAPPIVRGTRTPLAEVRLGRDRAEATTDWVDIGTVAALLPGPAGATVRGLALYGRCRVSRLLIDAGRVRAAQVAFEDTQAAVPVESPADQIPPARRYLQLRGVSGQLAYEREPASKTRVSQVPAAGGELSLLIDGALNDATMALSLRAAGLHSRQRGTTPSEKTGVSLGGLECDRLDLDLELKGLDLPTHEQNPAFVTAEILPRSIRNFFRKYRPQGPVNLRISVQRDADRTGDARFDGVLEPLGARCRYLHFPYDISDARGAVRFSNEGVQLDGLTGRHGSARIRLDGRLQSTDGFTGFDLRIEGRNVALDRDLYRALPDEYHGLWHDAAPLGVGDIFATVGRPHGSEELGELDLNVEIDVRLLSAALSLDDNRLERADGMLYISDGRIVLENLHGYLGPAGIRMRGEIDTRSGPEGRRDIHVEAAGAEFTRGGALHTADGRPLGAFSFDGRGDMWAHMRSAGGQQESDFAVHLTDGTIRGFDPLRSWSQARGWITTRGDVQHVAGLEASGPSGWLRITGALPNDRGQGSLRVGLNASDERIDDLLVQLVPARWATIREALGLTGSGVVSIDLSSAPDDKGRVRQQAEVRLTADHMRPTPIPLDLEDISAHLRLRDDGFELFAADARYGENGAIHMLGRGGWDRDGQWSDVGAQASAIDLTPDFIRALPGPLADLLSRLAVQGRMNTKLDRLRLDRTARDQWEIRGLVLLEAASMRFGVALEDFAGRLDGECRIVDEQITIDSDFTVERGTLAGRAISRWEGRLLRDAGERFVRLEDIRGRLCDGEVVGQVRVDPRTNAYELSATLDDLSFDELMRDPQDHAAPPRPGRLDGRIFLRGVGDDLATRDGGGELRVRNGSLLGSRVTASVVEASQATTRPISAAIERAEVRFAWRGHKLMFNRVDIRTNNMRLIGEGEWDTADDVINLTLIGAHPEDAPRLLLITDLLDLAGRELLQYRVEGTAAAPRVSVQPLHTLTAPLRKLLGDLRNGG